VSSGLWILLIVYPLGRAGWLWNERDEKPLTRPRVLGEVVSVVVVFAVVAGIYWLNDRAGFLWGLVAAVVAGTVVWLGDRWWRRKLDAYDASRNSAPRSQV
jgi:hypothetical protein